MKLLREKFVPMAIDNVDYPNQTAVERDFLVDKGWLASTNGQSAFTAEGRLLAKGYFFDARGLEKFLHEALEKFGKPGVAAEERKPTAEEQEMRASALRRKLVIHFPPRGVQVANMTWRVTTDYGRAEGNDTSAGDKYAALFQNATGVDRIWFTAAESASMAAGTWPDSATKRLARMLAYISGAKGDTVAATIALDRSGRVSGTWTGADGKPGAIKGSVTVAGSTVTGLQLLAQGAVRQVRDCGFSNNLQTIPAGKFPRATLLVELADPGQPMHRVTPYRASGHDYLE